MRNFAHAIAVATLALTLAACNSAGPLTAAPAEPGAAAPLGSPEAEAAWSGGDGSSWGGYDGGGSYDGGQVIYGVTASNVLLRFTDREPGNVARKQITGLAPGETLRGVDFRPATGQLYGLGSTTNRLYTVNLFSAAATAGPTLNVAPVGTSFGTDFNPTVDRLRVVSDADQNLRVNVDTGAVLVDKPLAYAGSDRNAGRNPNVVGVAYTNPSPVATQTVLYDLDSALDALSVQNPPNDGTLNTVGSLRVNASATAGFDITADGTGYAAIQPEGSSASSLYTVSVRPDSRDYGSASRRGTIGGGEPVTGLAVPIRY